MIKLSKGRIAILTILLVLIADQALKFWVKTTMMMGEEHHVFGNWFIIHFTENNGMAFGLEFGKEIGKYVLTIFRLVASTFIAIYISKIVKREVPIGFVIAASLVFAGAVGNIIDSVFYGMIFDHSMYQVSAFLPEAGGYAGLLQGRVVDMLYFPIINAHWPSWSPINANEQLIFFRPVFNLADSAITGGMTIGLLFYRKTLKEEL